jgi:hypothetical protein
MNRNLHYGDVYGPQRPFGRGWIALSLVCHGGGSASTSASQPTTTTSGANSPATVGSSSPINAGSGTLLQAGGNLKVSSDPAVEEAAMNTIAQVVQSQLDQQNNTNGLAIQAASNSQIAQQGQLSSILEAAANPTQAGNNSTVLYIVLAIAAAIVAVFTLPKMFSKS